MYLLVFIALINTSNTGIYDTYLTYLVWVMSQGFKGFTLIDGCTFFRYSGLYGQSAILYPTIRLFVQNNKLMEIY